MTEGAFGHDGKRSGLLSSGCGGVGKRGWAPCVPTLASSHRHIVIPGLDPGIHAAVRRKRRREMPGTSPGMTKRGVRAWRRGAFGHDGKRSGLLSSGCGGVGNRGWAPCVPTLTSSHRHTRTCSGYPCGRPAEAAKRDARNKSGYDGEGRSGMTERAFGHDGKRSGLLSSGCGGVGNRGWAPCVPTLTSSHRHTRTCSGYPCGRPAEAAKRDARNKSGHDGEGRSGMTEGERGVAGPPPVCRCRWRAAGLSRGSQK